jgi:hypothetical protein
MKDWRKLNRGELVHLIESMHSDSDIEQSILKTRDAQKEWAAKANHIEVCWECRKIARKLELE